jgi:undecaprenyl diphosphate synthase
MSAIVLDNLKKHINNSKVPNHVAVIMDGNGRWAKKIGKERFFGHNSGVSSVRDTIESCIDLGVNNLTLYVFSMENWKRPESEVKALMHLLFSSIDDELENLNKNNIKLNVIGKKDLLPNRTKERLEVAVEDTSKNTGLNLNLAISYGSKQEIIEAVKTISDKVKKNIISLENIDENIINDHLYTRNLDNVDLLIRTGGEIRVSNFLLWQISYAELVFLELLWPDFKKRHFYEAIVEYQKRARRFGKI